MQVNILASLSSAAIDWFYTDVRDHLKRESANKNRPSVSGDDSARDEDGIAESAGTERDAARIETFEKIADFH